MSSPLKYPQLHRVVCQLSPIPEGEWSKVEAFAEVRTYPRQSCFVRAGEPAELFGLVMSGLFWVYRVGGDGGQSVKAFRSEGQFLGAYVEMLEGRPSDTFTQALEDSQVLTFPIAKVHQLEEGHRGWTQLFRRLAEWLYVTKERREQAFLALDAEGRYEQFLADFPHLKGRVSQREIAAYLGITPVSLSRIVSRRRKSG